MQRSLKSRLGLTRNAPRRREELRKNLPRPTANARLFLQQPAFVRSMLILIGFSIAVSWLVVWSHGQLRLRPGQVMTDTAVNRLTFKYLDDARTEEARREARERAPDVYSPNRDFIDGLRSPLGNLPVLLGAQTELDQLSDDVRRTYRLDEKSLELFARYRDPADDGRATTDWLMWVDKLIDVGLVRHPLIPTAEWQSGLNQPEAPRVRAADGTITANWADAIPMHAIGAGVAREEFEQAINGLVEFSGFPRRLVPYVAAGVITRVEPSYRLTASETALLAERRAAEVDAIEVHIEKGDVIYRAGDVLSAAQFNALQLERESYAKVASTSERLLPKAGLFGLALMLLMLVGTFIILKYPRISRNTVRLVALWLLIGGMILVTAVVSRQLPKLLEPISIATSLFTAIVLLLAYDQRLALFLSTATAALLALALDRGTGWFILLLVGSAAMIGQLQDVRHRNTLIRAAIMTSLVFGAGTMLFVLLETGTNEGLWAAFIGRAAWNSIAAIFVGFFVLGILPSIERAFDITTGMTLAELRDPSQPLLRQLQQRAPGTYNHSLQVANIAEAAADAIGADSLLVYVGALYHDIGKMNKPEYFIENQAGGFNKHSKLRPAMSLLVIIGHVKDGIELGREYGLPRALLHFIESHHGTTLIEYFYHAAKEEAEGEGKGEIDEVEFRYPGPRPRTKEAACLMLSDAVESASRAMAEPNPSRIEGLVRKLSRKRLLDGQFNECDLTFRELGLIEESIIARVCAIHHGRIAYPKDEPSKIETSVAAG